MNLEYEKIAQHYLDDKWMKDDSGQHTLHNLCYTEHQRERFFFLGKDDGKRYRIEDGRILYLLNTWLLDNYPQHLEKFCRITSPHIRRIFACIKQITRLQFPKTTTQTI